MRLIGGIWASIGGLAIIMELVRAQKVLASKAVPETPIDIGFTVLMSFFLFIFPGLVLYGIGKIAANRKAKKVTPPSS